MRKSFVLRIKELAKHVRFPDYAAQAKRGCVSWSSAANAAKRMCEGAAANDIPTVLHATEFIAANQRVQERCQRVGM